MARHVSDDSGASSDEGIAPVKTKNKENRAPAFSLTAGKEDSEGAASKSTTKQAAPKRSKAASAPAKATSSKSSKRSINAKSKAMRDASSDEEELDEEEEVVAETQEEDTVMLDGRKATGGKKGAKGASGKKSKPETSEDSEGTAAERRLQAKLDLTTTALKQLQQAFDQLSVLRSTKAEDSEKQLTAIAAERQEASYNTIQLYKTENDELRAEIAELRANGHSTTSPRASSRPSAGDKPRVTQLEEQLATAVEEKQSLVSQIEELRQLGQGEERKKLQERDGKWEKELARTIKAKDEEAAKTMATLKMDLAKATKDLSTVNQELEAEIQHSKSLQAKLKGGAPVAAVAATSAGGAASSVAKLTDELEQVKMHLALNEDLTGFSVVSVKSEPAGECYSCLLSDCRGQTGTLHLKLTFHPDETVSYQPDLDAERDAALVEVLPEEMQKYMRFQAEACGNWFRSIFSQINRIKA